MKRDYTPLLLLLCVGALILGGFLPALAGAIYDNAGEGVGYAQVSDVELKFDETGQGMTIREKYALLTNYADSMELPVSMVSLSEKKIQGIVEETITLYRKAGLIPSYVSSKPQYAKGGYSAVPYLVSWGAQDSQSAVFWHVEAELNNGYVLWMLVDDETGLVLSLDFYSTTGQEAEERPDLDARIYILCSTFLEALGDSLGEDPDVMAKNAYYQGTVRNFLVTGISWSDILYGEVKLDFCVHEERFYVRVVE